MVTRRWVWAMAGLAAGALVGVRVAQAAGRADEDRPGSRPTDMQAPTAVAAGSAAAAAKPVAKAPVRKAAPSAYAADAARSATRLPPDERAARAFLRTAAIAARVENDASRLAATRAQGDSLREFAADLLKYHAAADPELAWLLRAREMAPPMLETPHRKALNQLARLGGARFDRAYLELVSARRQRSDVQQFEQAAAVVTDPALKAWIERQLPSLREQQLAAQRLAGGHGAQVAQPAGRLRLAKTMVSSRPSASNTR